MTPFTRRALFSAFVPALISAAPRTGAQRLIRSGRLGRVTMVHAQGATPRQALQRIAACTGESTAQLVHATAQAAIYEFPGFTCLCERRQATSGATLTFFCTEGALFVDAHARWTFQAASRNPAA